MVIWSLTAFLVVLFGTDFSHIISLNFVQICSGKKQINIILCSPLLPLNQKIEEKAWIAREICTWIWASLTTRNLTSIVSRILKMRFIHFLCDFILVWSTNPTYHGLESVLVSGVSEFHRTFRTDVFVTTLNRKSRVLLKTKKYFISRSNTWPKCWPLSRPTGEHRRTT